MQALSLQIVNPQQERDVSAKKIPAAKSEGREPSFKEMVESASKNADSPSKEKNVKASKIQDGPSEVSAEPDVAMEAYQSSAVFASLAVLDEASAQPDFQSEIPAVPDFEDLPSDVQISFLKSDVFPAKSADDFPEDGISFLPVSEMQNLQTAQVLSVDEPEKFLESVRISAQVSGFKLEQKIDAVQTVQNELALLQNSAALGQLAVSSSTDEKNPDFFNFELSSSDGKEIKEAVSLFENIFTVTDERSVEQKISDFKSEFESGYSEKDNSLNFSLSLSENARQNILSSNSQTAGASGSTFQQMLAQQIQFNAPDFARAGSIVLQDNNSGSINMILKPENLGNVKINLHLSDNVITGQITVNSKEAFDAFKQNMETLKQAFQNSGFENANLSLSYADTSSGSFAQGERQQSSEQFFSNKAYGDYASSAEIAGTSSVQAAYTGDSDRKISVVA